MSPENALYDVVNSAVAAAGVGTPLKDAEVHQTVYSVIDTAKVIRVGNCESSFAPQSGSDVQEYDAILSLQILAKVTDADSASDYATARDLARDMTIETAKVLFANPSLDGQVCDLLVRRAFRGWAKIQTAVYAVAILPMVINPSGSDL